MIVAQIYFGATDFLHNTKLSRRNILFVQYFNNSKCLSYLLRTNFNLEWFWSVVDYSLQKLVCTHKIFMRINSMFQVSEEERRKFEAEFNQYYKDLERAKEEWVFIISFCGAADLSKYLFTSLFFPLFFFSAFFQFHVHLLFLILLLAVFLFLIIFIFFLLFMFIF